MLTMIDGPAAGQGFNCTRSPVLLRVVHDQKRDRWDALDQLGDAPTADELIYVYVMTSLLGHAFITCRGADGRRKGQRGAIAKYKLYDAVPSDHEARNTKAWRGWADAQSDRVEIPHRKPTEQPDERSDG